MKIKTVGELKSFLKSIDDDATIVLQIKDKKGDDVYIGMNDDTEAELDEMANVVTIWASLTDIA